MTKELGAIDVVLKWRDRLHMEAFSSQWERQMWQQKTPPGHKFCYAAFILIHYQQIYAWAWCIVQKAATTDVMCW